MSSAGVSTLSQMSSDAPSLFDVGGKGFDCAPAHQTVGVAPLCRWNPLPLENWTRTFDRQATSVSAVPVEVAKYAVGVHAARGVERLPSLA